MVVVGGLGTTPRSPLYSADITFMGARAVDGVDKKTLEMRTNKAKIFHGKVLKKFASSRLATRGLYSRCDFQMK